MKGDSDPFIVIDVESNGLYGQAFCVGAIVMDYGGRVLSDFICRCPIDQVIEDFVEENVIPPLDAAGIEEDAKSPDELKEKFIEWYADASTCNPDSRRPIKVYVDVGYPVDTAFLYSLRGMVGPYPLLDVATMLYAWGEDPLIKRSEFAADLIGTSKGHSHDPRWDAELSGLCIIKIQRQKKKVLLGGMIELKTFSSDA